jgi:hypothetical protein
MLVNGAMLARAEVLHDPRQQQPGNQGDTDWECHKES